jgi:hypothetical protein
MSLKHDDSIVTTDIGTDRMYLELTPTLRLRSDNPYQVVLERLRDSVPVRKTDSVYVGWFFEGFFPNEHFFEGSRKAHTNNFKRTARKLQRTDAIEHMVQAYWNVWQHVNTCGVKLEDIAEFIRKAKEHEYGKLSEKSQKSHRTRLGNNLQPSSEG